MCVPLYPGTADDMFLDLVVCENFGARTICDDPSLKESHHSRHVSGDNFHVVLDEEHRDSHARYRLEYLIHERELLLTRNATGWLIQKQKLRSASHRHRDVKELASALREFENLAIMPL